MNNPAFLLPLHPLHILILSSVPWTTRHTTRNTWPFHRTLLFPVYAGAIANVSVSCPVVLERRIKCSTSKKTKIAIKYMYMFLFIYLFNVQPVLPPTKRRMLQCLLKIWFPTLPMKNGEGHITCFYRVIFNSTTTQSETVQLPIVPLWKCHSRWLVHGRLMVCLWDLHKHPVGVEFLWPIVSQQK